MFSLVENDSDDELYASILIANMQQIPKRRHGGSDRGKHANKNRERAQWGERLMKDYFGEDPTYDAQAFRRRFRMRRELFEYIVVTLVEDDQCNYFVQKPDATGLLGFLPEQKVTCALRMLAYGSSADQLDELIRIGESTAIEALKTFCSSIICLFGAEYLRKPTQYDMGLF